MKITVTFTINDSAPTGFGPYEGGSFEGGTIENTFLEALSRHIDQDPIEDTPAREWLYRNVECWG